MKKMFINFKGNVKKYIDYLMSVDFGDLFINVLILICILVLSAFVFVPIGMVESIIRDFVNLFGGLPELFYSIYSWIFNIISFLVFAIAFVYMFNKRFEDIEGLKKQMKEKSVEKVIEKEEKDMLELPKTKDSK